jgi:hypothetical protein
MLLLFRPIYPITVDVVLKYTSCKAAYKAVGATVISLQSDHKHVTEQIYTTSYQTIQQVIATARNVTSPWPRALE